MLYLLDNREEVSDQGNDVILVEFSEDLFGGGKEGNGYMDVYSLWENPVDIIVIPSVR